MVEVNAAMRSMVNQYAFQLGKLAYKRPITEKIYNKAADMVGYGGKFLVKGYRLGMTRSFLRIPMTKITDKLYISIDAVTVGLFEQVMERREITSYNAGKSKALNLFNQVMKGHIRMMYEDISRAENVLTHVNYDEAQKFTIRFSDLTGRNFRLMTVDERNATPDKIMEQLKEGGLFWLHENNSMFFLCGQHCSDIRYRLSREDRWSGSTIRFVEDKIIILLTFAM